MELWNYSIIGVRWPRIEADWKTVHMKKYRLTQLPSLLTLSPVWRDGPTVAVGPGNESHSLFAATSLTQSRNPDAFTK